MQKFKSGIWTALAFALLLQGCAIVISPSLHSRKGRLRETMVQDAERFFTFDKILIMDLSGVISGEDSRSLFGSSKNSPEEIKEILNIVEKDPAIRAILLRIDSPGGDITPTDTIYQEIMEFKKKTKKPVIAIMTGVAASGGFYISMAADRIYAQPTTLVGNIGVIAVYPKLEGLTQKIGVDMRVIKSCDKKDIGSMWRDFSPEESEILQNITAEYYEKFLDIVASGRENLNREKIRALADGRIYTAKQALEAGLIDGIVTLPEAINLAKASAGIRDASVVMYQRPGEYKENIYSQSSSLSNDMGNKTQIGLINLDAQGLNFNPAPRFMYLWLP